MWPKSWAVVETMMTEKTRLKQQLLRSKPENNRLRKNKGRLKKRKR
jgi:hypothetical protein